METLGAEEIMSDKLGILYPKKKDYMDLKAWMKRNNLRKKGEPDCVKHGVTKWVLPVTDLLG